MFDVGTIKIILTRAIKDSGMISCSHNGLKEPLNEYFSNIYLRTSYNFVQHMPSALHHHQHYKVLYINARSVNLKTDAIPLLKVFHESNQLCKCNTMQMYITTFIGDCVFQGPCSVVEICKVVLMISGLKNMQSFPQVQLG